MSATELRRMRWWDIPSVMAIEESVFPDTAWSSAQFWSELAQDDRAYLVMEQSGRIAAYGGVMVRPPIADIQTIAVDSDHRGRGFARDLLERLLATAEDPAARRCSSRCVQTTQPPSPSTSRKVSRP